MPAHKRSPADGLDGKQIFIVALIPNCPSAMAPVRQKKWPSDQSTASTRHGATEGSTRVPLKGSPSTPHPRSPIKRQRMGISVQQKQALIDNLQLEGQASLGAATGAC